MPVQNVGSPEEPLFSLANLTLINCTPAELVYVAARAGYDAVSPRFITMNVPGEFTHSPLDKNQIQATKTALETTGLKVLDIELARITEDCDPRDFEAALELGGELGARHMIMSAWTSRRDDRNFLLDVYSETCDLAAPYGLTIDLEFPSFSRLRTLDEVLDIVRAADRPNGGILVDTLYLHLSRVDLGELLHVPTEWLHFLEPDLECGWSHLIWYFPTEFDHRQGRPHGLERDHPREV